MEVPAGPPNSQEECHFLKIPPEIRTKIYRHLLHDFPNPSSDKKYGRDEAYARPGYFSPRITDISLLLVCRAIYIETWVLPFMYKAHTYWLCIKPLAPPACVPADDLLRDSAAMANTARKISRWQENNGWHIDKPGAVHVENMQIFAQVHRLKEDKLATLFNTSVLRPRELTLTIRMDDWDIWAQELRLPGAWIEKVCKALPDSVTRVNVEIEQEKKKSASIDSMAKMIREKWFFKTRSGTKLLASLSGPAGTEWHQPPLTDAEIAAIRSYVADDTEATTILGWNKSFYVVSIPFAMKTQRELEGGEVSEVAQRGARGDLGEDGWESLNLALSNEPTQVP